MNVRGARLGEASRGVEGTAAESYSLKAIEISRELFYCPVARGESTRGRSGDLLRLWGFIYPSRVAVLRAAESPCF